MLHFRHQAVKPRPENVQFLFTTALFRAETARSHIRTMRSRLDKIWVPYNNIPFFNDAGKDKNVILFQL